LHPAWVREVRDAVFSFGAEGIGVVRDLPPRPAFHMKQWGSWTPDPNGLDPNAVWVTLEGRMVTSLQIEAYDLEVDGAVRMRYAGPRPGDGGKYLDGRDYCEFPSPQGVPA
jgi:hypothetical protein